MTNDRNTEPAVAADGAGIMGFYRVTGNCWGIESAHVEFS